MSGSLRPRRLHQRRRGRLAPQTLTLTLLLTTITTGHIPTRHHRLRARRHPHRILIPRQLPLHILHYHILIPTRIPRQSRIRAQHNINTPITPRLGKRITNIHQRRLPRVRVRDLCFEAAELCGLFFPGAGVGRVGCAAHELERGREERVGVGVGEAAPGFAVGGVAGRGGLVPGADAGLWALEDGGDGDGDDCGGGGEGEEGGCEEEGGGGHGCG